MAERIEHTMRASYRSPAFNHLEESWIHRILQAYDDEKITESEMESLIDLNHQLARQS